MSEDLSKMQQHRDAWRGYAYGIRNKPTDYIDGNMVDRPMTFLEINAERLGLAEAKLREFDIEWDGKQYSFTPRELAAPRDGGKG
jgi:hypothetical protein